MSENLSLQVQQCFKQSKEVDMSGFILLNTDEMVSMAFNNTKIEVLVIVLGEATYIPEGLAIDCWLLTCVVLPEGLEEICEWAFSDCKSLSVIELPSTLKCISRSAFNGCLSLETVRLPEGIEVQSCAFRRCQNLKWLFIGKKSSIYFEAFPDCPNLTVVIAFPDCRFGENIFFNSNPACQYIGEFNPLSFSAVNVNVDPLKILPEGRNLLPWKVGMRKTFSLQSLTKTRISFFSSQEKEVFLALLCSVERQAQAFRLPRLPVEILRLIINLLPILSKK